MAAAFETIQSAVTLVSVHAYPFPLLDKPAFRYLIKPGLEKLVSFGCPLTINCATIIGELEKTSNHIRNYIKDELSGQLFSVMFDITTKTTLSLLSVSASYMRNDKVVCRSLSVIKSSKRHTGENIADLVGDILKSFELSLARIFSIATDNGSNMLRATRAINEILEGGDENENRADVIDCADYDVDCEGSEADEMDSDGDYDNDHYWPRCR